MKQFGRVIQYDPKRCAICGASTEIVYCEWPCMIPVRVPASDIKIDDAWVAPHRVGKVFLIETRWWSMFKKKYAIHVMFPGSKEPRVFHRLSTSDAITERRAVCRKPVCQKHAREVGPETHYCSDHWNAWEKVA